MPQQIPKIEESTKFNFITSIWIVPFVALIIAGWLAYQYYSELGHEIRITFPKNEGLQAGQSHIKYRDVPIGTVMKITLQEDGEGVVVIARMDKTVTPYLNGNSKFWIVKPEVGISGVSGLETLISGTYINMHSEKGGVFKDEYVGLDHAYRDVGGGEYYHLNSPRGDSAIKVGTPIYFKNLKVGQVEYVMIALDGSSIDVIVYIDKMYVPYVHTDSKFWIRNTLDVGFANGNLDVTVAPFMDLIQGAIEFSSRGSDANSTVPTPFVFQLYKNRNIIESKKVGKGGKYIKLFEITSPDSVAKLKVGASVEYDGYNVGSVKQIKLSYDTKTHKMIGRVLLEIDTSSFATDNDDNITCCSNNFCQAVKEGLRAKITSADIITGMLFVDLVFDENATKQTVTQGEHYAVLPTIKSDGGGVMNEVKKVLAKLNELPLKKLITSIDKVVNESSEPVANANKVLLDLQKTVKNINDLTGKKSFAALPDEVNKALKELSKTLRTTKKVVKGYDNNSLLTHQITETLKVVTETSKEMQEFLELLNRKPTSMIFGDK